MYVMIESSADKLLDNGPKRQIKGLSEVYSSVLLQGVNSSIQNRNNRLKIIRVLQFKYQSAMGGYSGVIGQHWGVCYRYRWERGHVSGRGGDHTMAPNSGYVFCIPPPGAGRMSAEAQWAFVPKSY